MKVFADNAFPIPLMKQSTAVRCVDLSANREKLAVVDDYSNLFVYDIKTQQQLYKESGAISVAWNTEFEEMLSFTGNGNLYIKTSNYEPSSQRLPGFVVGFKGCKIFSLFQTQMNTIDVPQSSTFYRFLEDKNYEMAYRIACLGVTEQEWRMLGTETLQALNFEIARKAFIRIRDLKFIEFTKLCETQH